MLTTIFYYSQLSRSSHLKNKNDRIQCRYYTITSSCVYDEQYLTRHSGQLKNEITTIVKFHKIYQHIFIYSIALQ